MKHLLLVLALSLTALAAGNPADQKAVLSAVDQFNQAAKAGDTAALEKLLSPDLIYGHSNAKIENKAECIAALGQSKPDFRVSPGATVNIYGNTAVVHGKMTAHLVQNGTPNQIPLDFIQVWVKQGNRWVMVARHTTRLPS